MDLRNELAIHAPIAPPWFEPQMQTERPKNIQMPDDGEFAAANRRFLALEYQWSRKEDSVQSLHSSGHYPLTDELKKRVEDFHASAEENIAQMKKWDLELKQQAIFQWPWFYADKVILEQLRMVVK